MMATDLSVILPVMNEGENLRVLLPRMRALLERDCVMFVLARRSLADEFGLTGDIAELRKSCDEDRLGGGRNGVVIQEGVSSPPGDTHIIREQVEIHQA